MPITYTVVDEGTTVLCRAAGDITTKGWLAYRHCIAMDDRIKQGFRELLDITNLTNLEFAEEGVEQTSEVKRKFASRFANRRGAIVTLDPKIFDLARYSEKLDAKNKESVVVFNRVSTAVTWLGLTGETAALALRDEPYDCVVDGS